ncbi:hypothetical protein L210DRAFT_3533218 [Boletus edulis BED1]|uniref:Uncharacterized protein n=1 Tax=Boletus edulis BED1 TaxID=1328754 RepID=A0AAD4BYZ2_BOLED|nr:hypothetical protein L210DRAFT_3533218 [Boletus edulis BED1]
MGSGRGCCRYWVVWHYKVSQCPTVPFTEPSLPGCVLTAVACGGYGGCPVPFIAVAVCAWCGEWWLRGLPCPLHRCSCLCVVW